METACKEAQLILAIESLKKDPKLSIRSAAKIYNVSHVTLGRRLKGAPSRRDRPPNSRNLTSLEEHTIVERILDLVSRSFPPRLRDVEDMANRLRADRDAPAVGVNWEAMTEKNIQGAFRGAGIIPHSPEAVLSKLDVRLRTPTPPGSSGGLPEPWVSRTPHNPIEAISQSDYIKNRIARHQNSSPTSILGAVDHLMKGTQSIMHKLTLVQSEVLLIRGELDTLSKRRRAKKKHLKHGGSMSVAEAEDIQAQIEVKAQVKQETQQGSGRQPRSRPANRHCGTCGKAGHNSRTCQMFAATHDDGTSDRFQLVEGIVVEISRFSFIRSCEVFHSLVCFTRLWGTLTTGYNI